MPKRNSEQIGPSGRTAHPAPRLETGEIQVRVRCPPQTCSVADAVLVAGGWVRVPGSAGDSLFAECSLLAGSGTFSEPVRVYS